jgi:hypothetical protein
MLMLLPDAEEPELFAAAEPWDGGFVLEACEPDWVLSEDCAAVGWLSDED